MISSRLRKRWFVPFCGVVAALYAAAFGGTSASAAYVNRDDDRHVILAGEIVEEPTKFALEQVKVQTGISVLAQANQSLISLLVKDA